MAKSGDTASVGLAPSNSSVVNALPSVNSNTVTDLDLSGDVPATMVPPLPTETGCGVPPATVLPTDASDPFIAVVAPAASGRRRIVSTILLVLSRFWNSTLAPGDPLGFWPGGATGAKTSGVAW